MKCKASTKQAVTREQASIAAVTRYCGGFERPLVQVLPSIWRQRGFANARFCIAPFLKKTRVCRMLTRWDWFIAVVGQ